MGRYNIVFIALISYNKTHLFHFNLEYKLIVFITLKMLSKNTMSIFRICVIRV